MRRGLLLSALAPLARAPTGLLRTARWRWRTELLRCRSRLLLLPPPSIFSRCVIASRNGSLEGYGSLRLQFANDCLKGISIWTMIQLLCGKLHGAKDVGDPMSSEFASVAVIYQCNWLPSA
ncbi:uncharacterized protein LOC103698647 isoform X1 [Phoenix dactylifera]|uniref:Uncharacterized protein LOC103698647 isoform X1 n=1 Tax=Phoenix dactylifera TaxID=42345 RepID=A0A8B9AE84_PHODC|nr:uncharacterized protein LOC103700338 isoform X1 [Phoenix dactylifera]XP_038981539.1 uncharacterized protein LOC103698647 isoform X1 [Phoenix dactylifera]